MIIRREFFTAICRAFVASAVAPALLSGRESVLVLNANGSADTVAPSTDAAGKPPVGIVLTDKGGRPYLCWVDDSGKLRVDRGQA